MNKHDKEVLDLLKTKKYVLYSLLGIIYIAFIGMQTELLNEGVQF